jgi:glycosyltransferase involved in cell wall biosynthesis
MMRGKLVIASDIGGLGEIVGDAGRKFAAGDARALADAMRAVVVDPSLIKTIGETARTRARALFQRERMIAEHAELYRKLLAASR